MARAHHDRRTPGDWLRGLFRQPPPGFYSRRPGFTAALPYT